MKRRLKKQEYIFVASMLFGLVFGAGNLIFPAAMGQQAGAAMLPALIGFCITGVGLPLLGIAAISITASESLFDIGMKIDRRFAYAFIWRTLSLHRSALCNSAYGNRLVSSRSSAVRCG